MPDPLGPMISDDLIRRLALVGSAVLLFCAAYELGITIGWRHRSGIGAERRLSRSAKVVARGVSLGQLVDAVSAATGCKLACASQSISDTKLIVYSHRPLEETLRMVAQHLGFRWCLRRVRGSGGDQGWVLVADPQRTEFSRRRREFEERDSVNRLGERLEAAIGAFHSTGPRREALLVQYPFIRQIALIPALRARVELAAELTVERRRAVLLNHQYTSPTYMQMGARVRRLATVAMLPPGTAARINPNVRYTLRREQRSGVNQLWFRTLDTTVDRRPGIAGTIIPFDTPQRASGRPLPPESLMRSSRDAPPYLYREVVLKDDRGRPLADMASLPEILASLANETGLEVISDFCADPRLRYDPVPFGRRPLWQLLDLIAAQYGCAFECREGYVLLRRERWYGDEVREVPDRLLRSWITPNGEHVRVSAAEFLQVLHSLTEPQLSDLPWEFPGVHFTDEMGWERFLATLDERERQRFLSRRPVVISSGTKSRRRTVASLLGLPCRGRFVGKTVLSYRGSDSRFITRLRVGDRIAEYETLLPFKLRQPSPVTVQFTTAP